MDATCRFCGNPAEVVTTDGDSTCGACSKRAERRRLIFDVSEGGTPRRDAPTLPEKELGAPSSPPEATRMLDLLDLAKRTQASLATSRRADELDVPLDVREAILLIDSIAPASIDPAPAAVEPAPAAVDPAPTSSPVPAASQPGTRRLRAIYSGVGLLVVMAALVVAKAQVGREVASAAPEQMETTALLPATPQAPSTDAPPVAAKPTATPSVTAAPTAAPQKAKSRPAPPRPKAPTPADTPEIRASAEPAAPAATPHVDLLDAMQAAVAAHSAPAAAPKVDCAPGAPGGTGCPRAATGASPVHP